ncbi:hypothetical protein RCL1_004057 [Eukaryota sp. TZLM3-RCL]
MDDLNQIGPIELLQENFTLFVNESKAVGLSVNPSKCGVWGFESASIRYDNNGVVESVPFTNLSENAVRCLGTWIGNETIILNNLQHELLKLKVALSNIADLNLVPLHLRFYTGNVCFSSNLNHFYRSLNPQITIEVAKEFNAIKTTFLAKLLGVRKTDIKENVFFSAKRGGAGYVKAPIITEAAFIGGMKNFLFHFRNRFPTSWLQHVNDSYIEDFELLSSQLDNFSNEDWIKLFPIGTEYDEIQSRSLETLTKCVVNLQAKITDIKESQQFANLITKHSENKRLTSFLKEVGSCEDQVFNPGSCLITQQPS